MCGPQKDSGCRDKPNDEAQRRGSQITRPSVLISYQAEQCASVRRLARRRPQPEDDGPNDQVNDWCSQNADHQHLNESPHGISLAAAWGRRPLGPQLRTRYAATVLVANLEVCLHEERAEHDQCERS